MAGAQGWSGVMGANLYIEIDGQPVKTADALWIQFAPCGCMCALSNVEHPDKNLLTEDDARRTFTNTGTAREADLDTARGFRVQLVTFAAYRGGEFGKFTADCSHEPRYGVAKAPIPGGFAWARDRWSRRRQIRHLLPTEAVDDYKWRGSTLCGLQLPRVTWSADEWMKHESYECAKCAAKATSTATPEQVAP